MRRKSCNKSGALAATRVRMPMAIKRHRDLQEVKRFGETKLASWRLAMHSACSSRYFGWALAVGVLLVLSSRCSSALETGGEERSQPSSSSMEESRIEMNKMEGMQDKVIPNTIDTTQEPEFGTTLASRELPVTRVATQSESDTDNYNENGDEEDAATTVATTIASEQLSSTSSPLSLVDSNPLDVLTAGLSSTPSSSSLDQASLIEPSHEADWLQTSWRDEEENRQTIIRNSRKSPEAANSTNAQAANNTSVTIGSSLSSSSPLDYDDFDLDYQLKVSPREQQQQQQQNLNKRDYEQTSGPPVWSALLANQPHVFTSSVTPLQASQTTTTMLTTGANASRPQASSNRDERQLSEVQPFAPSLLTLKSQQLSQQELARLRPHLLLAYEAGDTGAELLAHGDLLATASGDASLLAPTGRANETSGSAHWMKTGLDNKSTLSSTTPVPMINLLNGSPVINREQDVAAQRANWPSQPLAGQQGNRYAARPMLQHLVANSQLRAEGNPAEVTTIVVDSTAASQTEAPSPISAKATTPESTTTTSTSSVPTASSGSQTNSSQANQWFNYPHPNLHHNPLLLHHILNKPASFYGAASLASSTSTTTTTTDSPTTAASNKIRPPSPPSETVNIIERPTLNAMRPAGQQPINVTLLQMQLNEMQSIAATAAAQKSLSGQLNTISSTFAPATRVLSASDQQQATRAPIKSNLVQQVGTRQAGPMTTKFASQIMAAPSFLQEVYTPRPTGLARPIAPFSAVEQQLVEQNNGSWAQPNNQEQPRDSNGRLSDEDMSTYVALLASLSSAATANHVKPTERPRMVAAMSSDSSTTTDNKQQNEQLAALLQLVSKWQANGSMTSSALAGQPKLQPSREFDLMTAAVKQPGAWVSALNDAKLVGLSDEVQAQIYRDHLAPVMPIVSASQPPAPNQQELQQQAVPSAEQSPRPTTFATPPRISPSKETAANNLALVAQLQEARQHYKQLAFIGALKASLARLQASQQHELQGSNDSHPAVTNNATSGDLMTDLADSKAKWNANDELDEASASNSSSSASLWPTPGHEKQIIQDSIVHETIRMLPFGAHRPPRPAAALDQTSLRPLGSVAQFSRLVGPLQTPGVGSGAPPPRPPVGMLRPVYPVVQAQAPRASFNGAARPLLQAAATVSPAPIIMAPPPSLLLGHKQQALATGNAPTRIMLERFPLAAAPAYMFKWPTLAGGTITTSGNLQPPMPPSARLAAALRGVPLHQQLRQQRPAAFISASPIGALRFLGAIAPPRLRPPAPGGGGYYTLPPRVTSAGLGSAPSTLHVQHQLPPVGLFQPRPLFSSYLQAPGGGHMQHHYQHAQPAALATQPGRLIAPQFAPGGQMQLALEQQQQPTEASGEEQTSSGAEQSASVELSQMGSIANQGASPGVQLVVQPSRQVVHSTQSILPGAFGAGLQPQQPNAAALALTRLQQATASLVELTSLASLVEEMVKDNEQDSSPAVAFANAISSITAQNPAFRQNLQSSQSNSVVQSNNEQQQQQVGATGGENQQQQQQPFSFKSLLSWRGANGGHQQHQGKSLTASNKLRELSALLATMSGSGQQSSVPANARLRVKYIRVPVAVYETSGPNGVTQTSEVALLSPGSAAFAQSAGGGGGGQRQLLTKTQLAELNSATKTSDQQQDLDSVPPQSQKPRFPSNGGNGATTTTTTQSSDSLSPIGSSSEFLYDEMSAESGAHHQYMSSPMSPGGLPFEQAPSGPLFSLSNGLHHGGHTTLEARPTYYLKSSSSSAPKRGKGKRGGSKKKLFSGSSAAKAEEEEEEPADEEEDTDNDDLLTGDLPILESLISALVHGGPVVSAASHSQPIVYAAPGSLPWRPRLASLRGSLLAAESSPLVSYAQPNNVIAPYGGTLAGTRPSSAGQINAQSFLARLPLRQRGFNFGEVVGGALGARKLISSLFAAHNQQPGRRKHHGQNHAGGGGRPRLVAVASNKRAMSNRATSTTTHSPPPLAGALTAAASALALSVRNKVRGTSAPGVGLQASKFHAINFPSIAAYDASSLPSKRPSVRKREPEEDVKSLSQAPLVYKHAHRARGAPAPSNATLEQRPHLLDQPTTSTDGQQVQYNFYVKQTGRHNARGPVPESGQGDTKTPSWLRLDNKSKTTMPLYHIVADHYNKQNAGHTPTTKLPSNVPSSSSSPTL